jgi:hypothetical protein
MEMRRLADDRMGFITETDYAATDAMVDRGKVLDEVAAAYADLETCERACNPGWAAAHPKPQATCPFCGLTFDAP